MTDEAVDQAQPQSISDRIANAMGFPGEQDDSAQTGEIATEAAPDLFDLEIDGQNYQLPGKLKDAFMRNEDYTKKTQELADQRRGYEQMRDVMTTRQMDSAFRESIASEAQEMHVIDAYLSEVAKANTANMNMEQLMRWKMERDSVVERRSLLEKQVEGKRSKFNDDVKARLTELKGKSKEAASKSIPSFSEDTEKAVRSYALSEGLTETEIDNVLLDPRSYNVLWKASQFEKVKAGATQAQGKVDKVLKVGAATERMPQGVRAKLDYGKAIKNAHTSGDKARVIETRLQGMFGNR